MRRMRLRAALRSRLTVGRRGVLSIASGTVGGQLLLLAAAPALARLYGPADFGVFTVIATLVATLGTVAAFRFELAVPLPEEDRHAYGLVALGLTCALLTAVGGTVVVALAGGAVAVAFGQPALRTWLWLVPLASAAMGCLLVLNQLAVRHRRYGSIGRRNLLQSVSMLLTQLLAGVAGFRSGGLALGLGVGQAAGALMLLPNAHLRGAQARAAWRPRELWRTARRYRRFPLVLAPSGLINVLGLQLPVLLIAYWYGSTAAGWLGLTQRVLAAPAALLGVAVAQVYLGELSRAARETPEQARLIFFGASRRLALIALPGAVAVVVGAPALFRLLFGDGWAGSGAYAQALAIGTAAHFVASPLSQTLIVFGRQGLQLTWDVGRVLVVTGAVGLTVLTGGSALTAVWAFGLSAAVTYGASWLLALRTVVGAGRAARSAGVAESRELARQA
ncbi:oligosaccharide flippase family protein [Micromonospora sp. WMMA1363]|uniref:lipopolysaccharide biosynthesis protein n=1 Tax=Micromonospora sp. WMMA1363 TaxID=3053985 RepID=UPI00259D0954|nr:oligosaccharide flippase family protein [Micromonospora sp. WMMA1363]MDM4718314.1 oligosaccharide flippase family protein [Micromonospora sp. WMMA1363]